MKAYPFGLGKGLFERKGATLSPTQVKAALFSISSGLSGRVDCDFRYDATCGAILTVTNSHEPEPSDDDRVIT